MTDHIFVGLLLLPPVALKLASTGWRFLRYYTRSKPYRLGGPPRLLLRMLAPLFVASTLTLFGSGVALIVVGHGGGLLLSLYAVSFGVWGVIMIVHVLAWSRAPSWRFREDYLLTHGCFFVLVWPFRHFGFGFAANVAVTVVEPVIVSWQSPFPEQRPLHATKR